MIKLIAVIVVLLGSIYYLFPLINVIGDSMFPTYKDGEILVGTRLFRISKLKIGDVIIYRTPTDERIVIKRIAYIDDSHCFFYCLGDNRDHSYDSRHYGFISSKEIVCKVINQREEVNNVCN